MDLMEFQAKELLERFKIAVPAGRIAETPADALRAATRLPADRFAVKVQVRAGERRQSGGVQLSASPEGVAATAESLFATRFVSPQTASDGEHVRWLLVEEAVEDVDHVYAAVVIDRDRSTMSLLVSPIGGDGVEERIRDDPDLLHIFPLTMTESEAPAGDYAEAARAMDLTPTAAENARQLLEKLAQMAVALDAVQIEINPLAVRRDGALIALDAKVILDDNALFRHPALAALSQANENERQDPTERDADLHRINFVPLEGEIGVVANGAGLALTTLDLITQNGGRPANFMDIRTTATSLDIAYGVRLLLNNPATTAIIINIHGGGMQRCDTIAEGIAVAMKESKKRLPLMARLAGNNADFARKRLIDAGIDAVFASSMDEAARLAVTSGYITAE